MSEPLLIAFDLETTGPDPATCSPVQVCMISEQAKARRILLNALIKPSQPISDGARAVHHISNEMVTSMPDEGFMAWIMALVCQEMRPKYIVGFNSKSFDEPVVKRCCGFDPFPMAASLDVLDIAYRFYPELDQHKLGFLYQTFFGKPLSGAHDAAADVDATLDVLHFMLGETGRSLEQMAEEMATPKRYDIFPISKKYKGWKVSEVPRSMASWLLEQNAKEGRAMRPDLQATVEYILAHNR